MGVSGLQPRMPLLHGNPHLIQLLWSATVWLCQLAITPILRHVQTHRVVFATESPADFNGLGVIVGACSGQQARDEPFEDSRLPCWRFGYCLIEWRAGRLRRPFGIRSVPT